MVSVKDLQDVVDDLKVQAGKRASDLLGEGRTQVRTVVGGHSDSDPLVFVKSGTLKSGL